MTRMRWSNPPREADPARVQSEPKLVAPSIRRSKKGVPAHRRLSVGGLLRLAQHLRRLREKQQKLARRLVLLEGLANRTSVNPIKRERHEAELAAATHSNQALVEEIARLSETYRAQYLTLFPPDPVI